MGASVILCRAAPVSVTWKGDMYVLVGLLELLMKESGRDNEIHQKTNQ